MRDILDKELNTMKRLLEASSLGVDYKNNCLLLQDLIYDKDGKHIRTDTYQVQVGLEPVEIVYAK